MFHCARLGQLVRLALGQAQALAVVLPGRLIANRIEEVGHQAASIVGVNGHGTWRPGLVEAAGVVVGIANGAHEGCAVVPFFVRLPVRSIIDGRESLQLTPFLPSSFNLTPFNASPALTSKHFHR